MTRLTSEFWVSAYQRRRNDAGYFTAVIKRGHAQAGAIFIVIDRLDGTHDLYGPASQALVEEDHALDHGGRLFELLLQQVEAHEIAERMTRERKFDADLWHIASEARDGTHGLGLA